MGLRGRPTTPLQTPPWMLPPQRCRRLASQVSPDYRFRLVSKTTPGTGPQCASPNLCEPLKRFEGFTSTRDVFCGLLPLGSHVLAASGIGSLPRRLRAQGVPSACMLKALVQVPQHSHVTRCLVCCRWVFTSWQPQAPEPCHGGCVLKGSPSDCMMTALDPLLRTRMSRVCGLLLLGLRNLSTTGTGSLPRRLQADTA